MAMNSSVGTFQPMHLNGDGPTVGIDACEEWSADGRRENRRAFQPTEIVALM